ncbi:MAG: hypothetical protein IIA87_05125 [Nanoarchaeota archaeon]|nr:hypothetical protein [Nanoarchaeota archaeon]
MSLEALIEIGYTKKQAKTLDENPNFHHKRKTAIELENLIDRIAETYSSNRQKIMEIILGFAPFAGYNHKRVVEEAIEVYGKDNEERVKKAILGFAQFVGYNHKRVVEKAIEVYGKDNEERVKKAILGFAQFAGLNHERVIEKAIEVYGKDNEERIKKAILGFAPFAGYNHKRVVEEAIEVYGENNKKRVKKAILGFAPFAGYNHKRVKRQKTRLGRIVGLSKNEVIDYILSNPILSSYSAKRYLAAMDVARTLEQEGFSQNETMLNTFFNYPSKSPYVPKTNRKRISQVRDGNEPPLLKAMRNSLRKSQSPLEYRGVRI